MVKKSDRPARGATIIDVAADAITTHTPPKTNTRNVAKLPLTANSRFRSGWCIPQLSACTMSWKNIAGTT